MVESRLLTPSKQYLHNVSNIANIQTEVNRKFLEEVVLNPVKIAVIGAGSSYTPEIIEELVKRQEKLPISKITLMDIDKQRLETMAGFCRRFLSHFEVDFPIEITTDHRKAIEGAQFVLTQIRVGGNAQRIQDEKIPLKYDVIGQETTGPGGMFKALRTIPPMLEIARSIAELNPRAWMINYANKRVHGTTKQVPVRVFTQKEQSAGGENTKQSKAKPKTVQDLSSGPISLKEILILAGFALAIVVLILIFLKIKR